LSTFIDFIQAIFYYLYFFKNLTKIIMETILSFNKIIFLFMLGSILFIGCKKKTTSSDPEPDPIKTDSPSGYYINAEVNGTAVSTADGVKGYSIADATASGSDGSGGINVTYNCSFQKYTVSNEKYFELSFANANSADGNDSDELQDYILTGTYDLNDGNSPYFSLSYNDGNGITYIPDPNATPIAIEITEVIDLGTHSNKRVVKLKGQILTGRLYEYDFFNGFTSNYVDVTNLDFVIRFTSAKKVSI
jgi:hypothetical protein